MSLATWARQRHERLAGEGSPSRPSTSPGSSGRTPPPTAPAPRPGATAPPARPP